jgi:hypothetical protein
MVPWLARRASVPTGHELDKTPSKSHFSREICPISDGLRIEMTPTDELVAGRKVKHIVRVKACPTRPSESTSSVSEGRSRNE